jgi:hypothetical protein
VGGKYDSSMREEKERERKKEKEKKEREGREWGNER